MRAVAILLLAATPALAQAPKDPEGWAQHDLNRPQPTVVDPGHGRAARRRRASRPSDAVVLFDGKDLSAWKSQKGGGAGAVEGRERVLRGRPEDGRHRDEAGLRRRPAPHRVDDAPTRRRARARTAATAASSSAAAATRSRSSTTTSSKTYPDGQAGALYGQYPPLVNACRAAGPVAGLRHRLRGAAVRRGGQAR